MVDSGMVGEKKVRIGCASAFYGDSQLAARQLVDGGHIDYLVFDYLAEVTMAILSRAKSRDDNLGYAVDFVSVAMRQVLADCADKGIKVVANAGGVNVPACIAALERLRDELGLQLKIAGVYGDDLSAELETLRQQGLPEMETGAPLPERIASINAYLGARPIADALDAGADIVVTGRVVDSAVVLGPLLHEFGWGDSDYDLLAQGALAGHVIECGAQCTGGNFTDWQLVPDFARMSYPIAEIWRDGTFSIQITPGSGGLVTTATVGEQILYEIADPANYLLPDVACDFSHVRLEQVAENCVQVNGARGRAPGPDYKVCATWIDGYRLMGAFYVGGIEAPAKARANLDAWLRRTRSVFEIFGLGDYREASIEIIGDEDSYGAHANHYPLREVMAKFGVHHDNKFALQVAAAEIPYLATSAAPGMCGLAGGRVKPQPLMKVHSALIAKEAVPVTVQLGDEVLIQQSYPGTDASAPFAGATFMGEQPPVGPSDLVEVPLIKLAYARSGDKGDHANIGVMARRSEYLPWIAQQLTAQALAEYFAHLFRDKRGQVERYFLPGPGAFNFVLKNALGGGGTGSVRLDSQGKALGQMLLSMTVMVPEGLL
ncbi:acyclic terpene utilization AtuA family protein [Biformimicrobium ophioploci]|uniref:DUF1446 domain-containing protein n=1 Tax=Biformimicrobium ophioploci TaxID=3036711 RepID=A0ABQ6LXI6_9GAMM|nr:acyclic terpene utilization AtuA family protein [Microbulbifer sp. NKW57]GMG86746.1 DUF1446 domain-containing protein [Microbulbifer sp. NKW57]